MTRVAADASFRAAVDFLRQAPDGYRLPEPDLSQAQQLPDEERTQRIEWLEARIAPGGRILDLGCGRGEILHFLSRRFPGDHLGLEREPEFMERCRRIGVRAVAANFNDAADPALRFACSQRWDVVLIIDSLVYWKYPALVLAALQDRCGRVYLTVHNAAHFWHRARLLAGDIPELPNVHSNRLSLDWFNNRWTVGSFQAWSAALGYSAIPLARRSVSARYLPLGPFPGLLARSILFELTPR